ncbi:hypothetical protein HFP89_01945 [Wenzhouxiangella sp. XN79A]|uniref:hypothetical protein n=1 Tax=Wenzhouxiangella sp. XN79A TaxID=2724193 RepID=UPI00144A4E09|nr:hypothetical protein [Wenzhouxiangella sp. XN79A]NKI33926.1 hypothetical protein [Wenzhouxiangella sp. XN79A]
MTTNFATPKTSASHKGLEPTAGRSVPGIRAPLPGHSPDGTVDVVLIGHTGQVGGAVLERLGDVRDPAGRPMLALRESINRREHVIGTERGLDVRSRAPGTLAELARRLAGRGRPAVVVDCSADPDLPALYPDWLRAGIGVVTPNKFGFAGNRALYDRIQSAARSGRAPLGYAATVGAGLPVLATLRRLRASGRAPTKITAVVSGTLVQVFGRMHDGALLSEAVAAARDAGCTEPDPLDDLSGKDVARKLRILLREAGQAAEDAEPVIDREPVVEDRWAQEIRGRLDVIEALQRQDARWAARLTAAEQNRQRWIYRAFAEPGRAQVGPATVAADDPFGRLDGSDNRLVLDGIGNGATRVVIEGPGAGIEVTATSVLSDLAEAAASQLLRLAVA